MRVKTREIRNLYVLIVYEPRSRKRIAARRTAAKPFPEYLPGDDVHAGNSTFSVTSVVTGIEEREDVIEHITRLYTKEACEADNVVEMPVGDDTMVAQFLRYHVLVRVYRGDADAWLAQLQQHGCEVDGGDLRFVRWIRSRLRQDPSLLASIERMVDATPFWRVAEA